MGKTNQEVETAEEEDTESEESSEEATEEEDEDSGSDSESDESSDDESDEEEEKEAAPEDIAKFLDVAKLPKELLPLGKRMMASLTKKSQKLKQEYDDRVAELSTRYARSIRAEKALSILSETESFKMFLADARASKPYGFSSAYNRGSTNKSEESTSSNGDGNISEEKIGAMVERAVASAIEPFVRSYANQSRSQLEKNLPNFNKYRAEIEELEQEGIPLERAYQIASEKDRVAAAVAEAVKQGKKDVKRIPRTEGKSTATSSGVKVRPAKTLREALNFAANQVE